MKTISTVLIILVCAVAVAWIGNQVVSQPTQFGLGQREAFGRGDRGNPFGHDENHHHEAGHHGAGGNRGMNELVNSSLLFGGVAVVVVIPMVVFNRRKRAH